MCEHKIISVMHYASEETKWFIGCRVLCNTCDTYIFKSEDKGFKLAYDYIERNKNKFHVLFDFTMDNLNSRFNIKDGFDYLSL